MVQYLEMVLHLKFMFCALFNSAKTFSLISEYLLYK